MLGKVKKHKIISVHPRKSHNLSQAGQLSKIFGINFLHVTSIYFPPALIRILKRIFPKAGFQFAKRSDASLPAANVFLVPKVEITNQVWKLKKKHVDYFELSKIFQQDILKNVTPPEYCISFDTSSHLIFKEWKGKSFLILDLSTPMPQFRKKIDFGDAYKPEMLEDVNDFQKRLYEIYSQEIELADLILCGSDFVRESVDFVKPGYGKKCRVLVYGVDVDQFSFPDRKFRRTKDLKFVFAGGRVGWLKGSDTLLNAWAQYVKLYPMAELHFFGSVNSEIDTANVAPNVFFHGRVNREILIEQLKQMDVYVFPSTVEGCSPAVLEATAMQFPIVTTFNAVSVLRHEESAEIIKAKSVESLLAGMIRVTEDPDYKEKIARNAFEMSKSFTWDSYRENIKKILEEVGCTA